MVIEWIPNDEHRNEGQDDHNDTTLVDDESLASLRLCQSFSIVSHSLEPVHQDVANPAVNNRATRQRTRQRTPQRHGVALSR